MISKEDVVINVKIVDIAREFDISLEPSFSGNFNYKCKCPSINHKNGGEKTSSCYIDSRKNNFYCFGCNTGTNCIDFYMLCSQSNFSESFSVLRKRVDPSKKVTKDIVVENNFLILLETSNLIRNAMINNKDDLPWLNSLMMTLDNYILDIDVTDVTKADKILKSLKKKISDRYQDKKQ